MDPSTLSTLPLRRVENTIRQLLNDMRTVVETRCRFHGVGGGTTANSAAGLLPCIGVEIVADRTRQSGETTYDSIRRVFEKIGDLCQYDRYAKVGFPFWVLSRHGLAHGFYPNGVQLANGPRAAVALTFWIEASTHRSFCVDEMGGHLESKHLTRRSLTGGELVVLEVSAQHLYRDVKLYLETFLQQLETDAVLQELVSHNDEARLQSATQRAAESLEPGDLINLGV